MQLWNFSALRARSLPFSFWRTALDFSVSLVSLAQAKVFAVWMRIRGRKRIQGFSQLHFSRSVNQSRFKASVIEWNSCHHGFLPLSLSFFFNPRVYMCRKNADQASLLRECFLQRRFSAAKAFSVFAGKFTIGINSDGREKKIISSFPTECFLRIV